MGVQEHNEGKTEAKFLESLIRCHNLLGVCARSIVFMYKYTTPVCESKMRYIVCAEPWFVLIVAYLLFASGHDDRLHKPDDINDSL